MWIWITKIDTLFWDRFPTYRSTRQIVFKSSSIASDISRKSKMTKIDIHWWDRFPTYRSTSEIGFKSSLNASNTSQIYRSSRKTTETMLFLSNFDEKNSKIWIRETKIDILLYDRYPTYRSTSQIGFKSFLVASNRSQIHRSSRKTIETLCSRSVLGEIIRNVNLGDENRHTVMRPISNLPLNKSNCA